MDADKDENVFQCQICGHTHKVGVKYDIDKELYVKIICPHCKRATRHWWCGDKEEDLYYYYNLNIDPRYY